MNIFTTGDSFVDRVYEKAYRRLSIYKTHRWVFLILLEFLLEDEPVFSYPMDDLSGFSGLSKKTLLKALNELERLRLIKQTGIGKNRKFMRGSILNKIIATV